MRTYTADERDKALALAAKIGPRPAAAQLGIPAGTLSCWRFLASKQGAPVEKETVASAPERPAPTGPPEPGAGPAPSTRRPRVAKVYTPSQIAQALERVAAIGVRSAAVELGIARNTLREWERKAARAAKGEGPAPTSGPDPKDVEARRDKRIVDEWNKQQGLGPSQIRNQLRRAGIKVSVQTDRRVMEDAGYQPPKVERRDHTGVYEGVRPNQLWLMRSCA